MSRIFGTDKELLDLEQLANDGYHKLEIELDKPEEQRDFLLVNNSYYALHNMLLTVVWPSHAYRTLNKGGRRAERIEKFILQTVLMFDPRAGMLSEDYRLDIKEDSNDGMGGLKVYIDTNDPKKEGDGAENGEIFRRLQHRATEVRDAGGYELIFNVINYVREK